MTDLIRRLEEAKEGSRELDAAIAALIRHPVSDKGTVLPDWVHRNFPEWTILQGGRLEAGCIWEAPHFTTNLQDAVSAVPDDLWVKIEHRRNDSGERICVAVLELDRRPYTAVGWAQTFPLALCIAILRAMEAKNE
jgi:hypothetical protein